MNLPHHLTALVVLLALPSAAEAGVAQIAGSACSPIAEMQLTDRDTYRIEHLTSSRTAGLAEALRAESAEDRASVSELFSNGLYPISDMPEGDYQCRTIKLGGLSEVVVYQWFTCEISRADGVLHIAKTSGSQNFSGTLTPAGSGLLYRGALTYGYETEATGYGENAERDQVGCVTKDAEDGMHFVLELPYPVFESRHDVIELVRKN